VLILFNCGIFYRLKIPGLSVEQLTYESVREVLETGVFEIVEGECKASNCQGIILTPPKWDLRRYKIEQIICAACYMLEVLYNKHEAVEIHGIRLLQDFSNFSFIEQLKMEAALLTAGKSVMQFVQVEFSVDVSNYIVLCFQKSLCWLAVNA